jgi:hypothetical protein
VNQEAVEIAVTLLLDNAGSDKPILKAIFGKLTAFNKQAKSSVLAWCAVKAFLDWEERDSIKIGKYIWPLVEHLCKLDEENLNGDDHVLCDVAFAFSRRSLSLMGAYSLKGAGLLHDTYPKFYESFDLVMKSCANLGNLFEDRWECPMINFCALSQLHMSLNIETLGSIASRLLNTMLAGMDKEKVLACIDDIGDGNVDNRNVCVDLRTTFPLLKAFGLLNGLQIANKEHFHPIFIPWTERLFASLPLLWEHLSVEESYEDTLEEIARALLGNCQAATATISKKAESLQRISSLCHAHLFNPHPFVASLAIDLWCILIKNSSAHAIKQLPSELESLVNHFIQTYYFTKPAYSPTSSSRGNATSSVLEAPSIFGPSLNSATMIPDIAHLHALHGIHTRLKSILYRVASILPNSSISELDDSFKSYNCFKILNFERNQELFDRDCVLLDLLPLHFLKDHALYNDVMFALVGRLNKLQGSATSPKCTPSLLLTYRAILKLTTDKIQTLKSNSLSELVKIINIAMKASSMATIDDENFGDLLAVMLDICLSVRSTVQLTWKSQVSSLLPKLPQLNSAAKMAYIHYILGNVLYDLSNAGPNPKDFTPTLRSSFESLLHDSDWLVCSEAIITYYTLSSKFTIYIELSEDLKSLTDFPEDGGSHFALSAAAYQLILQSGQVSDENSFAQSLSNFKRSIFDLAERMKVSGRSEIFDQLSQLNARLKQLESTIADSNDFIR